MAQRLKGQEIQVLIVADGELQDTLNAVQNQDDEAKMEIIAKGYLGEKTDRHDDIFNGFQGSLELHLQDQKWYDLKSKIIARAKRETPDVQFNIVKVFNFPNGDTPTITFPDVKFGAIPEKVGARNDYVSVKLSWACDDYVVALS